MTHLSHHYCQTQTGMADGTKHDDFDIMSFDFGFVNAVRPVR